MSEPEDIGHRPPPRSQHRLPRARPGGRLEERPLCREDGPSHAGQKLDVAVTACAFRSQRRNSKTCSPAQTFQNGDSPGKPDGSFGVHSLETTQCDGLCVPAAGVPNPSTCVLPSAHPHWNPPRDTSLVTTVRPGNFPDVFPAICVQSADPSHPGLGGHRTRASRSLLDTQAGEDTGETKDLRKSRTAHRSLRSPGMRHTAWGLSNLWARPPLAPGSTTLRCHLPQSSPL